MVRARPSEFELPLAEPMFRAVQSGLKAMEELKGSLEAQAPPGVIVAVTVRVGLAVGVGVAVRVTVGVGEALGEGEAVGDAVLLLVEVGVGLNWLTAPPMPIQEQPWLL